MQGKPFVCEIMVGLRRGGKSMSFRIVCKIDKIEQIKTNLFSSFEKFGRQP